MEIQRIYFIGIGGIGMSALARYFLHEGREVAGYDRTQSALTEALAAEGAAIHYTDDTAAIPAPFREREGTVVVYTPAVPDDHAELSWFRDHGFTVEKRSQMLGHLSAGKYVMAVAGTHGKTTTSTHGSTARSKGPEAPFWAASRKTSAAIWCWATGRGWRSRPTSSTARSSACGPTWRSSRP